MQGNTASKLHWFTVRLALLGVPEEQSSRAARDLLDELTMRPHLKNVLAFKEAESHRIVVQVDTEGLSTSSASEGIAEELLEVVSAVFEKAESISVEVLETQPHSPA